MEATKRSARKSRLRCKDCSQPFKDNNDLIHHICSYSGECKYDCLECGKHFMSKASLARHASTHKKVKTESAYECMDCGEKFVSKSILISHVSTHNSDEAENSLAKHASTHEKEETDISLASEKESRETNIARQASKENIETILARHTSTHEEQICKFSCTDCESVFRTKRAMTAHSKIHKKNIESQKSSGHLDKLPAQFCKDTGTECGKVYENEEPEDLKDIKCKEVCENKQSLTGLENDLFIYDDSQILTDIKCEELCKTEESLSGHLPNYFETSKENLDCSQNYEVYESRQSLTKHAAIHTRQETSYQCMECDEVFHHERFLVKHAQVHKTKKESKCHEDSLVNHPQMHVTKRTERDFQCQRCNKVYTNRSSLYYHLQTHLLARKRFYKCQECNKVFTRKYRLDLHSKTHSKQAEKFNKSIVSERAQCTQNKKSKSCNKKEDLQCLECNKLFASKLTLTRHIKTHSGKTHMCHQCGLKFAYRSGLTKHMNLHTGIKKYECAHCSQRFSQKDTLKRHIGLIHTSREHKCKICGRIFARKNHLTRHLPAHQEKTYDCEICPKQFQRKSHLIRHMQSHQTGNPHQCEKCGKQFRIKESLTLHHNSVHLGLNAFECPQCNKGYYKKRDLNKHILSYHQGQKLYECDICGKKLNSSLRNHKRTHIGVKGFHCKLCKKSFMFKRNLKRHMVNHCKVSHIQCEHCNKVFTSEEMYLRHKHLHMEVNSLENNEKACVFNNSLENNEKACVFNNSLHDKDPMSLPNNGDQNHERVCKANNSHRDKDPMCLPDNGEQNNKQVCMSDEVEYWGSADEMEAETNIPGADHSQSNLLELLCHFCGQKFSREHNLKLHLKTHTEVVSPAQEEEHQTKDYYYTRKFVEDDHGVRHVDCSACGQHFAMEPNLAGHIIIHTAVKSNLFEAYRQQYSDKDIHTKKFKYSASKKGGGGSNYVTSSTGKGEGDECLELVVDGDVVKREEDCVELMVLDGDMFQSESCLEYEVMTECSTKEAGGRVDTDIVVCEQETSSEGVSVYHECSQIESEKLVHEQQTGKEETFTSLYQKSSNMKVDNLEIGKCLNLTVVNGEVTTDKGSWPKHKAQVPLRDNITTTELAKNALCLDAYSEFKQTTKFPTRTPTGPAPRIRSRSTTIQGEVTQNWPRCRGFTTDDPTKTNLMQSRPKCKTSARDDSDPSKLTQGYLCEECGEHFTKECNLTAHLITCKDASEYQGDEGVRLLSQVCEGLETWNVLPEEGEENGRLRQESESVEDRLPKDEDNPSIEVSMNRDKESTEDTVTVDRECSRKEKAGLECDYEQVGEEHIESNIKMEDEYSSDSEIKRTKKEVDDKNINIYKGIKRSVELKREMANQCTEMKMESGRDKVQECIDRKWQIENQPEIIRGKENQLIDTRECEVRELKKENDEESELEGDYCSKQKKTWEHDKVIWVNCSYGSQKIMVIKDPGFELEFRQTLQDESDKRMENQNICKKIKLENVEDEESVENEGLIAVNVEKDKESAENEKLKNVYVSISPQETVIKKEIESEMQLKYGIALENMSTIQSDNKIEVEIYKVSEQGHDAMNTKMSTKKQLKDRPIKLPVLMCEYCNKRFAFPSQLATHNLCHTKDKAFTCEICQRSFARKVSLTNHLKRHKVDLFQCEFCGKTFAQKSLLDDHVVSAHTLESLSCLECGKQFTQKSSLKTHLLTHKNVKRFICEHCGDQFSQKGNMRRHLLTHGISLGDKVHVCAFCNQVFAFQADLNKHLFSHKGNKPHQCQHCSKSFLEHRDLKRHEVVHTGEKKYKCPVCQKRFTQKGDLRQHSMIHTGVKNYKCDVCKKEFTHRQTLNIHKLCHTEDKHFACEICHKRFRQKITLARHLVTHQSHREKLTCDVCGRSYSWDYDLNKHRREKHQL